MRLPSRVLLSVLVLGALSVAHAPLRRGLLYVLRAPFAVTTGSVVWLARLPHVPRLDAERTALRRQLAAQEVELTALREQVRHLQQASRLLRSPLATHGVIARVLTRSPVPTQHTLLVDRGTAHGVRAGSAVFTEVGLIGQVIDAQSTVATVLLLTDPDSRVAALVERSRETGLLVGQGHGRCELIYLDAEADVTAGDRVLTAGLGGIFAKGMVLGTVMRVARDPVLGSSRAVVAPAVAFSRLEEVVCLLSPDATP